MTHNNIPAFPSNIDSNSCKLLGINQGMTLRDYFAGQALIGLCSNREFIEALKNIDDNNIVINLAGNSYEVADAMLKEREKGLV